MASYDKKVYVSIRRYFTKTIYICDKCGRELNWVIERSEGQFCEDCWSDVKQQKKMLTANKQ